MVYIFTLILYAVTLGFIGLGIFMLFVGYEKKKTIIVLTIALILVIAGLSINKLIPVSEGERTINVDNKAVSEIDGVFHCVLNDDYLEMDFSYETGDKAKADTFCKQFNQGEEYTIKFVRKDGVNMI
ncbi:hypothetical protein [Bacillus sp. V2I10]|uniref:hypothetical protein n=1 Tax=Bacillus sp. V2I10 TaxID=3042276 RepID=UPI00277E3287|nr:hypothetical protein [Bacillus sp. V2I10]MDQ0860770.1 hypothetical protein [Bacillus sp. V2I10]